MFQLAQACRPRRTGEWTEGKAVTFIVTLAATRSVTLAAARAGMSRKSAYALKCRNPSFAAAWAEAIAAAAGRGQGAEGNEAHDPHIACSQGNSDRSGQSFDWFLETLAKWRGESGAPQLAGEATLP